ncbi:hypothetical protein IGB42_02147 [Andreprevotia sp. IGB-42]|nr:hypothetical protein IGB42_02147 [Andreprevotia sp. IGB-42]
MHSGVRVVLREVVLRSKPAALLQASPKGTVPILITPAGQVLEQSADIMRWALQQHDPGDWLAATDAHCAVDIEVLLALNDQDFKPLLDRYKYPERHAEQSQVQYRQAAEHILAGLNARIQRHGALCRDTLCLADIAIAPFIRQFAQVDAAWFAASPYPALRAWLAGIVNDPWFEPAMQKYPQWQPGDAPVVFPD